MKHDTIRVVDHRHPIHDRFCRCRDCKPPLVDSPALERRRWPPSMLLAAIAWAAVILILTV